MVLSDLLHDAKFWTAVVALANAVLFYLEPEFPKEIWAAIDALLAIVIAGLTARSVAVKAQERRIDALSLPHCAHGVATSTAVLNVRADASIKSQVRGQLQVGQAVTVWAIVGDWVLVQADDGLTGWCARSYLVLGEMRP